MSGRSATLGARRFPTTFAAQVKGFDLADHVADTRRWTYSGLNSRFAVAAAKQAWPVPGCSTTAAPDYAPAWGSTSAPARGSGLPQPALAAGAGVPR
ncbi:MAG: hypothetical protein U0736_19030 [Gemmataceae bacterium]